LEVEDDNGLDGNLSQNISIPSIVAVDNSPDIAFTGDEFTFNVTMNDFLGIVNVSVKYWYSTGNYSIVRMDNITGNYWVKTVTVENTLDTLHYCIIAEDLFNNSICNDVTNVIIIDNVDPNIENVQIVPFRFNTTTNVEETTSILISYLQDDEGDSSTDIWHQNSYNENIEIISSGQQQNSQLYYFNGYDTNIAWDYSPGSMVDGDNETFVGAYSTTPDKCEQLLNNNTGNNSTPDGKIGKVELRARTWLNEQASNDGARIYLKPVFNGINGSVYDTEAEYTTPTGSEYWNYSNWLDITDDEKAPDTWTWDDVKNLSCRVIAEFDGIGSAWVTIVEIYVTEVYAFSGYVNISADVTDNIQVNEVFLSLQYPDFSVENISITQNMTDNNYYCNRTYDQPGVYIFHIWANDTSGNDNISADYSFEIVNQPPSPPVISGPINGKVGTSYTYTFTSTDPDDDDIAEYIINWGDGPDETITGPFPSGTPQSKSHTWTSQGTFTIKAKSKDIHGAESDWGELTVTIPKDKVNQKTYQRVLRQNSLIDISQLFILIFRQ
jgi:hypothetical protein